MSFVDWSMLTVEFSQSDNYKAALYKPCYNGLSRMAQTAKKDVSRRVRHLGKTIKIKVKHYYLDILTLHKDHLYVNYSNSYVI